MSRERSRSRSTDRDRSGRRNSSDRDLLELCWKPVRDDPQNFDAWVQLLQTVETVDDAKAAREAFDSFLEKFPYCFGYWRKYAELERRHKHTERAIEVYEKGVAAIPLSIDLWLSFLALFKEYAVEYGVKQKRVRQLYERALAAAGAEFRSDKLWEDYIAWEMQNENYDAVLAIYDRLLKTPTLLYGSHFEKFQEFVNTHEPHVILPRSEFDRLYSEIEEQLKEKNQEIFVAEETPETTEATGNEQPTNEHSDEEEQKKNGNEEDQSNVKDENLSVSDDGSASDKRSSQETKPSVTDETSKDVSPKTESKKKYNEEALTFFRTKTIDKRRKLYAKTEHEISKRWTFEEQIKRPYFHFKPLERTQLKNWRQYLEFEIKEGDHERIQVLFERCLIACALYEDMWIRYARYMEKAQLTSVRSIYERACCVHLARKPTPHISWALFEEKQGNFDEAKAILAKFDKNCPGLAIIQLRRLGLERRHAVAMSKKRGETTVDYSDLCRRYEMLIHDETVSPRVASHCAVKFARFQAKIRQDSRLAEKIILDALERDKGNERLYLFLVDSAYVKDPMSLVEVVKALDYALDSKHLTDTQKMEFSRRKLELLEEFGDDVDEIQEHYEFHIKLAKSLGLSGSGRKRGGELVDGDSAKKTRNDSPAVLIAGSTGTASASATPVAAAVPAAVTPIGAASGYYNYYYGATPAAGAVPSAVGVQALAAAGGPYQYVATTSGYYYSNPYQQ